MVFGKRIQVCEYIDFFLTLLIFAMYLITILLQRDRQLGIGVIIVGMTLNAKKMVKYA